MVGITARVGEKGQVVIPKPIRDNLGIGRDSEVIFDVEEDRVIIQKRSAGLDELEEFFTAFKKRKFPKHIDWSAEFYSRYR